MLTQLYIDNVAVIEHAELMLEPGLTVLTGETGAGKSILIDALSTVLGERANRSFVRSGCPYAMVTAVFDTLPGTVTEILAEGGYAAEEDGTLILRRRISAENKSLCFIGDQPCTAAVMRRIGRLLVNIHGQHENQALLAVERHVEYLDRLGGLELVHASYEEAYRRYCDIHRRLRKVVAGEEAMRERLDILQFQAAEIDEASLVEGEEEQLSTKREMLRHADKLRRLLQMTGRVLEGSEDEDGAVSAVEQTAGMLKEAGRLMPQAEELAVRLFTLLPELQDIAHTVGALCDTPAFDPEELERVEDRLALIHRLCDKYGGSVDAVIAHGEQVHKDLALIESSEQEIGVLTEELEKAKTVLVERAARLTEARQQAATTFSKEVGQELRFLNMPCVTLEVAIEPAPMTAVGADKVEFLLSANPGEPPRPLAKIASGGELSRIMLALKSVMAAADEIPTLIFDEIDSGISGQAASKVGYKLRGTAATGGKQVLCVTHLAQIAACAHHHLLIEKQTNGERTFTQVRPVNSTQREEELARIIGGQVTSASLNAAREMLEQFPKFAEG